MSSEVAMVKKKNQLKKSTNKFNHAGNNIFVSHVACPLDTNGVSKSSHTHYLNLSCGHIATFLAPSDERKLDMLLMRRMRTTGGNYFHPKNSLSHFYFVLER